MLQLLDNDVSDDGKMSVALLKRDNEVTVIVSGKSVTMTCLFHSEGIAVESERLTLSCEGCCVILTTVSPMPRPLCCLATQACVFQWLSHVVQGSVGKKEATK